MFASAPVLIVQAPYESTMGLVQKIFYFHFPSWIAMFTSAFVCGLASTRLPVLRRSRRPTGRPWRQRSWPRVRPDWPVHRPVVGAEGVGRVVVMGRPGDVGAGAVADLRRRTCCCGASAGRDRSGSSAAVGLFGMFNVPFVYWSVNLWRTLHPKTSVVPTPAAGHAGCRCGGRGGVPRLLTLLMAARARLERRRGELEGLFLALED